MCICCCCNPNNCTKEYAIDVFITKVNTIEDQYACDSYNLPAIVGQGDYYTASGGPNGGGIKLSLPYSVSTTTSLYVYAEDNSRVFCSSEDEFTVTIYRTPVVMPYLPIIRCGSYTLPPFVAPVNKYFTQSGGPVQVIQRNFQEIQLLLVRLSMVAETGTAATKSCSDENLWKSQLLQTKTNY
jgi:hypothetical protein